MVTRDLGATHIPWRGEWARQVRRGFLPLWNPKANGGRPLWADPNAQALYPGTLLFLILPPDRGMVVFLGLHHLWLVAGFAYLARKSGASAEAAAAAAAILGTSGVVFSLTTFPNALGSFSWLPWALGVLVSESRFAARRSLGAGGLLGLSFLAGEPVTAGIGLALALAWVASKGSPVVSGALVLLGFGSVALPVLLPLAVTLDETVRGTLGTGPQALAADCLAPRRLVELIFPRLLGTPLGDAPSGFWAAASFPWKRYYPLVFLGAGTAALLFAGLRYGGAPARFWAWALGLGAAAAAAPAVPGAAVLLSRLPGGSLWRFAIKALQATVLAAVPLVARGLAYLSARPPRRRWVLLVVAAAFLVPALRPQALRHLMAHLYPASAVALQGIPDATWQWWIVADSLANAVPLLALALTRNPGLWAVAFLFSQWPLLASVHVMAGASLWRTPPAAVALLPTDARVVSFADATGSRGDTPLAQVLAFRDGLTPDYGAAYGLSYVLARGPDGLEPVRGELLAAFAEKLPPDQKLRLAAALGAHAVVLPQLEKGCLGVDGFGLCIPPRVAPPAYLARRLFPGQTLEEAAAWLAGTGFEPGADAVLESLANPVETAGGEVEENPGPPHHRIFRIRARERTWLIVQQNYLTSWRASVDGQPVKVYPANFARVAVPVPAGEHQVELWLDLWPYALGCLGPVLLAFTAGALQTWGRREAIGASGRSTQATAPAR